MNGKREQFSTTLPIKTVNILRKHALVDERITMSEMLERYQAAYLRELEREREEKKLSKVDIFADYDKVIEDKEREKELLLWDNVDLNEKLNNDGEW